MSTAEHRAQAAAEPPKVAPTLDRTAWPFPEPAQPDPEPARVSWLVRLFRFITRRDSS